jgi:hypothetical protein
VDVFAERRLACPPLLAGVAVMPDLIGYVACFILLALCVRGIQQVRI